MWSGSVLLWFVLMLLILLMLAGACPLLRAYLSASLADEKIAAEQENCDLVGCHFDMDGVDMNGNLSDSKFSFPPHLFDRKIIE